MRIGWVVLGLSLSVGSAHAEKWVASGKPLILYSANATNPDCSSAGAVVMRVLEGPEHGRVSIQQTGVFPNFPAANLRSACNRRRVAGVRATYVSERGYAGDDFVVLQILFPAGRGGNVRVPIRVM